MQYHCFFLVFLSNNAKDSFFFQAFIHVIHDIWFRRCWLRVYGKQQNMRIYVFFRWSLSDICVSNIRVQIKLLMGLFPGKLNFTWLMKNSLQHFWKILPNEICTQTLETSSNTQSNRVRYICCYVVDTSISSFETNFFLLHCCSHRNKNQIKSHLHPFAV